MHIKVYSTIVMTTSSELADEHCTLLLLLVKSCYILNL